MRVCIPVNNISQPYSDVGHLYENRKALVVFLNCYFGIAFGSFHIKSYLTLWFNDLLLMIA